MDEVEVYAYAHIKVRNCVLMLASTLLYVKPKWIIQPPLAKGRFQKI